MLSYAFIIILKKHMENVNKTKENEWEYKGHPSWFKMINAEEEQIEDQENIRHERGKEMKWGLQRLIRKNNGKGR